MQHDRNGNLEFKNNKIVSSLSFALGSYQSAPKWLISIMIEMIVIGMVK
ncbi:unnamed protein product, partial [Rotaria socialis]